MCLSLAREETRPKNIQLRLFQTRLYHSTFQTPSIFTASSMKDVPNKAVVAFGSNMGDRVGNIEAALKMMRNKSLKVVRLSSLYETKPMYYDDQDPFLNGVCQIETSFEALQLLDTLQTIENDLGRKRIIDKGPRTIDLDIILFNQEVIKHPRLEVPHRLMLEREFVLRPLAE